MSSDAALAPSAARYNLSAWRVSAALAIWSGIAIARTTSGRMNIDQSQTVTTVLVLIATGVGLGVLSDRPLRLGPVRSLVAVAAWAAGLAVVAVPPALRAHLLAQPAAAGLIAVALLAHIVGGLVSLVRRPNVLQGDFKQRSATVLSEFLPAGFARVAAAELAVIRYVFDWRIPRATSGLRLFGYYKGSAVVLWTLVALSFVEAGMVHILLSIFKFNGAWIVIALGELGVLYFAGLANSMRALPIEVSPTGARVRAGLALDFRIPAEAIETVRYQPELGSWKKPGVLKASIFASPNVVIDLSTPIAVKRPFGKAASISRIGVRPDDAQGFIAALQAVQRTP